MKTLLFHPLTALIITVLAIVFFLSLQTNKNEISRSSDTIHLLEQEVDKISSETSVSEEKLEDAKSPLTKEKIARDELLMQKPGETILQLPPIEETDIPEVDQPKTPWEQWKELLF